MDALRRVYNWFQKPEYIHVGQIALSVERPTQRLDIFKLACHLALKYIQTGKIDKEVNGLTDFLRILLKTDLAAKWYWMWNKAEAKQYIKPATIMGLGMLLPLLVRMGNTVGLKRVKRRVVQLAVAGSTIPIGAALAYATLPREKLSVYRLRTQAESDMGETSAATDCLVVEEAEDIKDSEGNDIVIGSRLTNVVATVGPRRNKYAAKIAQVARSKVGYLSNTPENKLIYQRVLLEIMDKDCVRYCDRDYTLPLAIGLCFVYQDGVREASGLWASKDALGLK